MYFKGRKAAKEKNENTRGNNVLYLICLTCLITVKLRNFRKLKRLSEKKLYVIDVKKANNVYSNNESEKQQA